MILRDTEIRKEVLIHTMIEPYNEKSVQPASYDIHLDSTIKVPIYTTKPVGAKTKLEYKEYSKENFILPAGGFVLASAKEMFNIPNNITGKVEGISSVGRLGLIIHTAGVLDAGYNGSLTLELFNASGNDIDLTDFDRIGQILFYKMSDDAEKPYMGKYNGQIGVEPSRYFTEYSLRTPMED